MGCDIGVSEAWQEIDLYGILNKQLEFLIQGYLYVLCTCVMYIYDYNSALLSGIPER